MPKISPNQEHVLKMMASRLPPKYIAQPPKEEKVSGEFLFLSGVDEDSNGDPIQKDRVYDVAVPNNRRIDHLNRLRKIHKKSGRDGVFDYIKGYLQAQGAEDKQAEKAIEELHEYLYDSGNYENSQIKFVRKNTFYKIKKRWEDVHKSSEDLKVVVEQVRHTVRGKYKSAKNWLKFYQLDHGDRTEEISVPIAIIDSEMFAKYMKKPEEINKVKWMVDDCHFRQKKLEVKVESLIHFIAEKKMEGWMNKQDLAQTDEWLDKTYRFIRL